MQKILLYFFKKSLQKLFSVLKNIFYLREIFKLKNNYFKKTIFRQWFSEGKLS